LLQYSRKGLIAALLLCLALGDDDAPWLLLHVNQPTPPSVIGFP
jgi:hypothetical protein